MRKAQALTMSQTVKYPFTQAENKETNPVMQQMFMPYIEGPSTDWTVNDSL